MGFSYLVIGNGRMSKHMRHYFDCLKINYQQWNRSQHSESELKEKLSEATHALILISDSAIESFTLNANLANYPNLTLVHFSGSLTTPYAFSAHPLQTFNNCLYTLEEYQQVPFILEIGSPKFSELLPGLQNPHYQITSEDKAYYHSLCVLANNVTTLLWQKFYREMNQRFGIADKDLNPYLIRTLKNIQNNPKTSLTGPIVRKDIATLEKNLAALEGDQFYSVFQAIIDQFVVGETNEKHP